MKPYVKSHARFVAFAIGLLSVSTMAWASSENVLHTFAYTDGAQPGNGVIFDAAGNLYGTASTGGSTSCGGYGCGVVFKLTPGADGEWKESTIYAFTGGDDGYYPGSPLIFDAAGNLFGTAYAGGGSGNGTVFKLTPSANGSWKFSILHTFAGGSDGSGPLGSLLFDSSGNLYGTTFVGGSYDSGTAFELSPSESDEWKETLLHTFTGGLDGVDPFRLVMDAKGTIYGSAASGDCACGVVYLLAPAEGNSWKETVLRRFSGELDGSIPYGLTFDSSGNLYGTASGGNTLRCAGGCGLVFRLVPNSSGPWKETVLHYFNGEDGLGAGGLIFGGAGNLYGWAGPSYGQGLIFSMSADDDWAEIPVLQFNGDGGYSPDGPIILNHTGHLFGTTVLGGEYGAGVVYEVTP